MVSLIDVVRILSGLFDQLSKMIEAVTWGCPGRIHSQTDFFHITDVSYLLGFL